MPFSDWLGRRSAGQLEALVDARRDLLHPPSRDVPGLAARAASLASVARARSFLEAPADRVLGAAITLSANTLVVDAGALSAATGYTAAELDELCAALADRALIWPAVSPDGREALGGWRVQPVLEPDDADDPAGQPPPLRAPEPVVLAFPTGRAEGFAAGNAAETLAQVHSFIDHLDDKPTAGLRQGGISARTATAMARHLHLSSRDLGFVAELAQAARLIGTAPDPADPAGARLWVPTDRADDFREMTPVGQWLSLVDAWWDSSRLPSADAGRILTPGADRSALPGLRRTLLATLSREPGDTAEALTSLEARLRYARPRMWSRWEPLVDTVVAVAAKLGILALSLRSDAVRLSPVGALLLEDRSRAAARMMTLLPEPTTDVVLESDLTAVVPGVAHPQVRTFLRRIATVEGGGQGTVFRFTSASVLTGLESGLDPHEVLSRLGRIATAPVPQALEYLILDAARTLGRVALGRSAAYVRADEPEQIDTLLAHADQGRLPGVTLQRLAPTVVVTTAPLSMLAKSLADLGIAAHAEEQGHRISASGRPLRGEAQPQAPLGAPMTHPSPEEIRALASGWAEDAARRLEHRSSGPAPERLEGAGPADTPTAVLDLLGEAAASRRNVRATVVDSRGVVLRMDLAPRSVVGGRVRGIRLDGESEAEATVVVHRIRQVAYLD